MSARNRSKEAFALLAHTLGPGKPEAEFRFHPTRRWRFDYAWPAHMVALEYEGIYGRGGSRHTSLAGYAGDAEKYSEAAILGWCVIRVTAPMVRDGKLTDMLVRVFEARLHGC